MCIHRGSIRKETSGLIKKKGNTKTEFGCTMNVPKSVTKGQRRQRSPGLKYYVLPFTWKGKSKPFTRGCSLESIKTEEELLTTLHYQTNWLGSFIPRRSRWIGHNGLLEKSKLLENESLRKITHAHTHTTMHTHSPTHPPMHAQMNTLLSGLCYLSSYLSSEYLE